MAVESGSKRAQRVFDRPCPHGHPDGRFASTGACVGCHRESIKKNRRKYPEKTAALKKRVNERRKEKIAAYDRAKYERESESIKARRREWTKNNPEQAKRQNQLRRDRLKSVGGRHTAADIRSIYQSQNGRCAYFAACGTELGDEFWKDHIVPIVLGGSNDKSNIQLTCKTCGLRKSHLSPDVFARRIGVAV